MRRRDFQNSQRFTLMITGLALSNMQLGNAGGPAAPKVDVYLETATGLAYQVAQWTEQYRVSQSSQAGAPYGPWLPLDP